MSVRVHFKNWEDDRVVSPTTNSLFRLLAGSAANVTHICCDSVINSLIMPFLSLSTITSHEALLRNHLQVLFCAITRQQTPLIARDIENMQSIDSSLATTARIGLVFGQITRTAGHKETKIRKTSIVVVCRRRCG